MPGLMDCHFSKMNYNVISGYWYSAASIIMPCPSAKIMWPYTAGGRPLKVNSSVIQGGLIIEGGLWWQGPYNAGSTIV